MLKKVGEKMDFNPWEKSEKDQKLAFKGTFDFNGEKTLFITPHAGKIEITIYFIRYTHKKLLFMI